MAARARGSTPVAKQIRGVIRDERPKTRSFPLPGSKLLWRKHFNRGFSHNYVSKIADKVAREDPIEADRTQIEQRMQFTRENYRMMR